MKVETTGEVKCRRGTTTRNAYPTRKGKYHDLKGERERNDMFARRTRSRPSQRKKQREQRERGKRENF